MNQKPSQTPTRSPQYFRDRILSLSREADKLCKKEVFTRRDLAVATELLQRYIETLEEIEESDISIDLCVVVDVVDYDKTFQFPNIDKAAEWITQL